VSVSQNYGGGATVHDWDIAPISLVSYLAVRPGSLVSVDSIGVSIASTIAASIAGESCRDIVTLCVVKKLPKWIRETIAGIDILVALAQSWSLFTLFKSRYFVSLGKSRC